MAWQIVFDSSTFSPTIAFLFPVRQWPGVKDKYGLIRVKDINNLEISSASTLAHHKEFFITDLLRKRRFRMPHNHFRLFPIHAVLGKMVAIPVNPSKTA